MNRPLKQVVATIRQSLDQTTEALGQRGIPSARMEAELLVSHVLGVPRLHLYLEPDRRLRADQSRRLKRLLERRKRRVPLQHLIGTVLFRDVEIQVGPEAFIPRPETEILAEKASVLMKGIPSDAGPRLLDLGTGSGCLALALARAVPGAEIHATDLSGPALRLARANARRLKLSRRIVWYESDLAAAIPPKEQFDVIVSNPPYIPTAALERLQPEVRFFEPRRALDGGRDGLEFYRRIAKGMKAYLKLDGHLLVEVGDDQASRVTAIFETYKWIVGPCCSDYNGVERVVVAGRPGLIKEPDF